ncbi:MAG: DsbA family protein, partial [Paracoccus sp. (in: a-proteobacteria)]|nr:DsbA family protein [Paracoccus sp. (in: a-proteobacteria)]
MKPLLAALALSTALASPALAFDPADMSDGERTALNEAIKAYILENPEVLVEAMGVLEDRRMANEAQNDAIMVKANAAEIFTDKHSWVGGNPEGDVTLVEFLDYRCT